MKWQSRTYFGERVPEWIIFHVFIWNWMLSLHIWPEQDFKPICFLSRFTQLRPSRVKYKYFFYKTSPALLKLPNDWCPDRGGVEAWWSTCCSSFSPGRSSCLVSFLCVSKTTTTATKKASCIFSSSLALSKCINGYRRTKCGGEGGGVIQRWASVLFLGSLIHTCERDKRQACTLME